MMAGNILAIFYMRDGYMSKKTKPVTIEQIERRDRIANKKVTYKSKNSEGTYKKLMRNKKKLAGTKIEVEEIDISNTIFEIRRHPKEKYDPEYCFGLIKHMNSGLDFESYAAIIGVAVSTLYLWKTKYDAFKRCYEIGQAARKAFFQKLLIKNAQTDQGNAQSCIFLAKNVLNYTDKTEMSLNQQVLQVTASIGSDGAIVRKIEAQDEAKNLLTEALASVENDKH